MNIRNISLKWKTAVPLIAAISVGVICTIFITGISTERIVFEEIKNTTLKGYRDMVLSSLTSMMAQPDYAQARKTFVGEMKQIVDIRIIRAEALSRQFGKSDAADYASDEAEREVMAKGRETIIREGQNIRGIYPYVAKSDFMGKNCLACHDVKEGEVLGAVSIRIPLTESLGRIRTLQFVFAGLGMAGIVSVTMLVLLIIRFTHKPLFDLIHLSHDLVEGEGDLTRRLHIDTQDEIGRVGAYIDQFIDKVQKSVQESKASAHETAAASEMLLSSSGSLSGNIDKQYGLVEESNGLIRDVAGNLDITEERAITTTEVLTETQKVLADFVKNLSLLCSMVGENSVRQDDLAAKMQDLTEQSARIKDILSVIADIADQTNLLSLNASIEAARAGEMGRGFAVVADEVRKLANKTQSALLQINDTVSTIVGNIGDIYNEMTDASRGMRKSSENTKELMDKAGITERKLGETVDVSSEVVKKSTYIATRTKELIEAMNRIIELSADNKSVAKNVEEISVNLSRKSADLQRKLDSFKV
jgi:methyl-accepting chemotaxis protein